MGMPLKICCAREGSAGVHQGVSDVYHLLIVLNGCDQPELGSSNWYTL